MKLKIQESEVSKQKQLEEIEILKQGEETNILLRRLLCLNKE
jgi:hypothetical protein